MRLGIAAYVVPFVFAIHPALILVGTVQEIILAVATAVVGVILIGIGAAGYLFRVLGWGKRILMFLAGLLLLLPSWGGAWLLADAAGLALGLLVIMWEWNGRALHQAALANPDRGAP